MLTDRSHRELVGLLALALALAPLGIGLGLASAKARGDRPTGDNHFFAPQFGDVLNRDRMLHDRAQHP